MSEKRFTLMENIYAYDGRVISEYVLDNEKRLTFEEVVDLLNQLNDENEQLRQQLQEKQEEEKLYANEIVKLNKEVKDNQFLRLGNDY